MHTLYVSNQYFSESFKLANHTEHSTYHCVDASEVEIQCEMYRNRKVCNSRQLFKFSHFFDIKMQI